MAVRRQWHGVRVGDVALLAMTAHTQVAEYRRIPGEVPPPVCRVLMPERVHIHT
jgi:hypothetical protein